jgi:phage gp46-like protein
MSDRKYTPGGSNLVDGNFERDYTIASQAGRLYMAERGNWIGGRGRLMGSRLHELEKTDDETPAEAERMIAEAFEPLTSTGKMTNLEVSSDFVPGREDALANDVDWTDTTQGDSLGHERESGRQG